MPFLRPLLVLTFSCLMLLPDLAPADTMISMYQRLFSRVDEEMEAVRQTGAAVLSPEFFEKAERYKNQAERDFRDGRSHESVQEDINRAREWLRKALDATEMAAVPFADAMAARDNALSADAPSYARTAWARAEEEMREATHRVERGDIRNARDNAREVAELYREAELLAIKENYLSGARSLIEEADDIGADRHAIKTFIDARQLLELAESELTNNRYDTDYPRDLARRARNEAQHAITITNLALGIRRRDFAVEDIIINYESPLIAIADELDIVPALHNGFDETRDDILERVAALQKDSQQLGQLRLINQEQAEEIARLSERLGIYNEQLAAEERYRALLAELEGIFTAEEAEIFRQGKNMIIRMIGLNFESGKADLTTAHMRLLAKVKYAIELSQTELTTIEGHTDSFGGDASNQVLSEARANSVVAYLKQDTAMADANMVAVGYGETRPIANNESAAGRERNRRIDVVIKLDNVRTQAEAGSTSAVAPATAPAPAP